MKRPCCIPPESVIEIAYLKNWHKLPLYQVKKCDLIEVSVNSASVDISAMNLQGNSIPKATESAANEVQLFTVLFNRQATLMPQVRGIRCASEPCRFYILHHATIQK